MTNRTTWFLFLMILSFFAACKSDDEGNDPSQVLQLSTARVGTYNLNLSDFSQNGAAPVDKPIVLTFSAPLNRTRAEENIRLKEALSGDVIELTFSYLDNDKTVSVSTSGEMTPNITYVIEITDDLEGVDNEEFPGYEIEFTTTPSTMELSSLKTSDVDVLNKARVLDIPLNNVVFKATFSHAIDPSTLNSGVTISGPTTPNLNVALESEGKTITVTTTQPLKELSKYQLIFTDNIRGTNGEIFQQRTKSFYTMSGTDPDFPIISDEALLTLVQQQTFKYFWNSVQSASGMARERNSSGDLVTSGGSGFGLMAIIVGIERGFITRSDGLSRLDKILDFLESADRFHGAWSHWINGNTGKVIPFSTNDNGGDLVETAFLIQGLLSFRQYLDNDVETEASLISRINALWYDVEWDWYTRGGQQVLYWHWSPDKEWIMNHQIRGHNETLITYVLAASSPTHTIDADVYKNGYARNGAIKNGKPFYDITLPLGEDYGGPLFFTHYSFLGLDPRELEDTYADYWTQNVNHSKINYAYSVANPKQFAGYTTNSWGLTASDNHLGYSAHSPLNDLGVISPTAALSSFPYTPTESMQALKFFYYTLGDRLWGDNGFYDAYNITEGWVANSYLAIDQGPIIVMIENHRTGLLWDLFMSAPEVQAGLTKLGFQY